MIINWPLITVLFLLSLPGIFTAMPRLIDLLLPTSSVLLKQRMSRIALVHAVLMAVVMIISGAVLSKYTHLDAPLLQALLKAEPILASVQKILLPVFLYTLGGLLGFLLLYYGVVAAILDKHTLQIMRKIRLVMRLDGCVLYGGVVEEILARWGLMNILVFFALLFTGQRGSFVTWTAIILSGMAFGVSQLPAYLAAGCKASRRFTYTMLLLNTWQAMVFGLLFWQHGILAAMMSHVLFHLGWWVYDKPDNDTI